MLLSREDIIGSDDRKTQDVAVPEWGGDVRVKALSGAERDAYELSLVIVTGNTATTKLDNVRAKLVAYSCVDEEGNRLFSEEDIVALGEKSAAALQRVFDVARKLSGLTDEDVEELAEGFGDAPSDDSTSD